jgi:serpin B
MNARNMQRELVLGIVVVLGVLLVMSACGGQALEPPHPQEMEPPVANDGNDASDGNDMNDVTNVPDNNPTSTPVPETGTGGTGFETAQSAQSRNLKPAIEQGDKAELVSGNSQFAFDLLHFLEGDEGNLIYSPYSMSLALAMTYAGARGETAQQMADTLHFTLPQERLHPAFNALDLGLSGEESPGESGDEAEGLRLNIVNALWGQRDYPFDGAFLDTLAENYGAGLKLLDFIGAPDASRVVINDWVSEQTEGRIEDLLPEDTITVDTRLVLTNAIYFYGAWLSPFEEEATVDDPFYLSDGSEVTVPMMNQTGNFGYLAGEGFQAISLPYEGGTTAFVVMLPDEGEFDTFAGSLDAGRLATIRDGLQPQMVALSLPRFEYKSEFNLNDTLVEMGMPLAFDSALADFSGMVSQSDLPGLYISDVVHKAFVKIDEQGTEAAAATGVVVSLESAIVPTAQVTMRVDRPFFFAIVDQESGTILFVGEVLDPSA